MSSDIQKKLLGIRQDGSIYDNESAIDTLLNQIRKEINIDINFRMNVLRRVKTLEHVVDNDLQILAQSLVEETYYKGDYVIKQDESGDSMYILEDGMASVIKTTYNDFTEKVIGTLSSGSHFGEIAIASEEIRNASIMIVSDVAKCLKLSKSIYDGVNNKKQNLLEKNKIAVATNIINSISFMKRLPATTRSRVVMALSIACFNDGVYICRQGSIGHQFYIIAEGQCRVTMNDSENQYENEVVKLQAGDYFGEIALIDSSNKRIANVISVGAVSLLCLSRSDFNSLLSKNDDQMTYFRENAVARKNKSGRGSILSNFRRISAFDLANKKNEILSENLIKRIGKYMFESLWNSMYSRLYRKLMLKGLHEESGLALKYLFDNHVGRLEFVESLSIEIKRIMSLESIERNPHEVELIFTFLNQENELKNKICKDWPSYMFKELCAKGKIIHSKSLKKIVDSSRRGEFIFLVLRGAVRVYSVVSQTVSTSEYQNDVFPGEIFGDDLFKGVLSEYYSAVTLTPCEIFMFLEKDILGLADEIDVNNMNNDKKMEYLRRVPLFKTWPLQDLYDLGTNLKLETFDNGTQIITKGQITDRLYFVVEGTVNLMRMGSTSYRTISCLQKYDYCGESGIINILKEGKSVEHLAAFCTSKVIMLTLQAENYPCIDLDTIHEIGQLSLKKREFRRERYAQSKAELQTVSKTRKNPLTPDPLPLIVNSPKSPGKWWGKNSPVPQGDLEDYNMLFDGTNDPIMMMATAKDQVKPLLMEQIKESIEKEKIIRFHGKNAKADHAPGFATISRKSSQTTTGMLYSARTDMEIDLRLEEIMLKKDRKLETSKTLPNLYL